MKALTKKDFLLPATLLALSAVPMAGGVARLLSFAAPVTPESERFVVAPAPVVVHIISVALYCLLGAFQFSSAFRQRWPLWHRRAGKAIALAGISSALSGIWMAQFYAIPGAMQGPLVYVVRLMVGAAMVTAIMIAWRSILRRDIARHEAWMIRAYALGQGAGTQVFVLLPVILIHGECVGLTRDLLMTLAWAINIVFAEWIIRRSTKPRTKAPDFTLAPSRA
ncbi:MAG: DUF2306 domain-containing protein [Sandaracinaceae bacterium]|jgi:hypothetical protein|nr:DUF2306 domain-containing protein [Sandaracinaceae bacterium]